MAYIARNVLFWPNPAWPVSAMTLFDWLFHSHFKWYKLDVLTQLGYQLEIVLSNYEPKVYIVFKLKRFSWRSFATYHTFFLWLLKNHLILLISVTSNEITSLDLSESLYFWVKKVIRWNIDFFLSKQLIFTQLFSETWAWTGLVWLIQTVLVRRSIL